MKDEVRLLRHIAAHLAGFSLFPFHFLLFALNLAPGIAQLLNDLQAPSREGKFVQFVKPRPLPRGAGT
jgi:hypothetical protein